MECTKSNGIYFQEYSFSTFVPMTLEDAAPKSEPSLKTAKKFERIQFKIKKLEIPFSERVFYFPPSIGTNDQAEDSAKRTPKVEPKVGDVAILLDFVTVSHRKRYAHRIPQCIFRS
jgi:hypothetical protein